MDRKKLHFSILVSDQQVVKIVSLYWLTCVAVEISGRLAEAWNIFLSFLECSTNPSGCSWIYLLIPAALYLPKGNLKKLNTDTHRRGTNPKTNYCLSNLKLLMGNCASHETRRMGPQVEI